MPLARPVPDSRPTPFWNSSSHRVPRGAPLSGLPASRRRVTVWLSPGPKRHSGAEGCWCGAGCRPDRSIRPAGRWRTGPGPATSSGCYSSPPHGQALSVLRAGPRAARRTCVPDRHDRSPRARPRAPRSFFPRRKLSRRAMPDHRPGHAATLPFPDRCCHHRHPRFSGHVSRTPPLLPGSRPRGGCIRGCDARIHRHSARKGRRNRGPVRSGPSRRRDDSRHSGWTAGYDRPA